MITAIRYLTPSDDTTLSDPRLARPLRVFYDLSQADVRNRLEQALRAGVEGITPSDLAGFDAGAVREAVLERLFDGRVLRHAYAGTVDGAERARTGRRTTRRLEHLRSLYHLSEAVSRAEAIETIYAAALDALQYILQADRAAVLLWDRDGVLRFKAARGLSHAFQAAATDYSPWPKDAFRPEPLLVADTTAQPRLALLRRALDAERIRAVGFVPLVHRERLLGQLTLFYDAPHRFSSEGVLAALTIAHHVAFALERTQAERALRESERTLSTLVNNLPGLAYRCRNDPEWTPEYVSEGVLELTGHSASDFLSRRVRIDRVIHPDDLERVRAEVRAALRERRPYELAYRIRTAAGEEKWVREQGRGVFAPDGEILALEGFVTDITERRRAEAERNELLAREQASRARAEAVQRHLAFLAGASVELAASLDYEATLDTVARLVVPELADWCLVDLLEADQSIRRVAAVHRDPARAELARQLRRWPPDPNGRHPAAKVIRTAQPLLVARLSGADLRVISRDAEHLQVLRQLGFRSCMVLPLVARGRTLGAISFISAEVERRYGPGELALAEELARRAAVAVDNARLYQEAQAAVAARDAFLARASHELRTPLTSALGTVRLLKKALAGLLREPPERLLDIANRNLGSLLALVNDLLDAARLRAGQERLSIEQLDLAGTARDSLDVVGAQAREKGVALHSTVPDGFAVPADRLKLEQVLVNLLANAVKSTPPGGEVVLEAERGDGNVLIRVRDTGVGIPAEYLERVFEPFFRVAPPAPPHSGERRAAGTRSTGLGLAICRQIVLLHGGEIWAESDGPGRGSTFTVRLPATASAKGEAA